MFIKLKHCACSGVVMQFVLKYKEVSFGTICAAQAVYICLCTNVLLYTYAILKVSAQLT